MSAISIIGLGAMGSALAGTLQRAGHDIAVWNRSSEKTKPFTAKGAKGAIALEEAVVASPVILVCIDSYQTTRNLLQNEDVVARMSGRTLVQLSTGTPREAQESAAWCSQHNVTYIDGAIECLPTEVGTERALFLFAGPEQAFLTIDPLFECLGGDRRYFGDNIRAPAALDLAWLSQRLGQMIGALHGICLCESEGVDVAHFEGLLPEGDRGRMLANRITERRYQDPDATVAVWDAVSRRFQQQARDAGVGSEFPDFIAKLLRRAIRAGYGGEDMAALVKVLRKEHRP
jgi:3-hydroxyisobutyrate dehydrogenase-like beta-hydroxyacid dehydrogenase